MPDSPWFWGALAGVIVLAAVLVRALLARGEGPPATAPAEGPPRVESVPNAVCPRYARFLRLAEGTPPPRDAKIEPAGVLAGRVALVSIFVDRPASAWNDDEVCQVFAALDRAAAWLTREASRYGVALAAANEAIYYQTFDPSHELIAIGFHGEEGEVLPVEEQSPGTALGVASRWVRGLGFADIVRFVGHVQRSVEADHWVLLFHPREAGRSFAIPRQRSLHRCVELTVCYPQYATLREDMRGRIRPDAATYVHELLHLFGASDKYDVVSLDGFAPGTVTGRDIMRSASSRLERLRIDPLTAREVGWPT